MSRKETLPTSNTHNVLSTGTTLTGNILADDDFRLDGTVEGNIKCKGKIIVGQNGFIKGDVECSTIDLTGRMNGKIVCSHTVILRATSVFDGSITTQIIEVEPGAKLEGSCTMMNNDRVSNHNNTEAEDE